MFRGKLNNALEKMVPSVRTCLEAADALQREHPDETAEQLARRAIRNARRSAAAAGAATGLIANPLVMIPAALADMAAVLRIEGALAGTIAALLDPQSFDEESLRADVVSILFPGAVSQALRQVGIRIGERVGQRLTRGIIREYLSKDVAKSAMRMVTRHLGMELTRKAILEKAAPLVGAGIGAGWNWVEVGVVGERALSYYDKSLQTPALPRLPHPRLGDASPIKAMVKRVKGHFRSELPHSPGAGLKALPGQQD